MIDALVQHIVETGIRRGVIAEADRAMSLFSFNVMFEQVLTCVSILVLSCFWNSFFETWVFLLLYIPLRIYAGGYHARSFGGCYAFSMGVYVAISLMIQWLINASLGFGIVVLVSVAVIIIKSPIADPNKPASESDSALYRKMVLRILVIELCVSAMFFICHNDKYLLYIGFAYIQLAVMLLLSPLNHFSKNTES